MNLQPSSSASAASATSSPDASTSDAFAVQGKLNRELVHKTDVTNVFVASINRTADTADGRECFIAELDIDRHHPFFFEHPLDHVPGLMLIEGTRQTGTAISHRFYDVSHDLVFVLNALEVTFEHFAELHAPLSVRFVIVAKTYRHDRLASLSCESQWLQFGRPLGTMNARWSFSPPALLARLRHAAKAGDIH
ncbi:AfsA-related hotdog domain-containing protein [Pandoraea bronchicola]|uniref:A-factor biosynthesis repeat-containing protein n=1 Tax=Pandoraea bronchicola TaxID=2508287 RepID=A0A5E5BXL5_9BURK|nr:AfsA-related hotdog domain-containing protein [Pandoraea bronchicola]VVE89073.1 A-factor biosynthesis repeat-containing protein [Pandoraea bronchicola]